MKGLCIEFTELEGKRPRLGGGKGGGFAQADIICDVLQVVARLETQDYHAMRKAGSSANEFLGRSNRCILDRVTAFVSSFSNKSAKGL
jgi:hypothetical protein